MTQLYRICHLTTAHSASDVRIFQKECRSLAKAGYHVTLVAPGDDSKIIDGVTIHTVPVPKSRMQRFLYTPWHVYRVAQQVKAQVYHFHDPDLLLIGILLKLQHKKVIYDAHENLPEDIKVKQYLPQALRAVLALAAVSIEWIGGLVFDGIVTVVPKIARRFPCTKTIVVANYPILPEASLYSTPIKFGPEPYTAIYIGGLGIYRGVLQMIRAIEIVNQHYPVRLALAGVFHNDTLEQVARNEPGWRYVDFYGWLSNRDVLAALLRAHIGLLLFQPSPHNTECSPNKLFEYLLCGLPIVMSNFPYWEETLAQWPCGIFVDPTSPEDAASAIIWLIEHPQEAAAMGCKGRDAVNSAFNWQSESVKLTKLYQRIQENCQ